MAKLFALVIIFSMTLAVYAAMTLEKCKCWDKYEPKQDAEGKISCRGKQVFSDKPCNLPEPPKCTCADGKSTGILTDKTGTWCSQSEAGRVIMKWPCENQDDWAELKVKYAEFEEEFLQDNLGSHVDAEAYYFHNPTFVFP